MEMIDQLTNTRQMAVLQSQRTSRILAVASGKGGVGKTNIALNLSLALTDLGKNVMLFDADTRLSNIAVLMGRTSQYTIADVISNRKGIADIAIKDSSGLQVICAGIVQPDLMDFDELVQDRFFQEIFRISGSTDLIIIDTSAGVSEIMMDYLLRADEVLMITTPEPTAISDAYALVKLVVGIQPGIQFKTILNFVKSEKEADEIFERFSLVTEHFLSIEPTLLGYVVEDKHVRAAVQKQNPFYQIYPNSKASKCITQIAERLI